MQEIINIKINGKDFIGWKNFNLNKSLGKIYADVSFGAIEDPSLEFSQWLPQNELIIFSNNDLIFKGRIDEYNTTISDGGLNQIRHETTIKGRSDSAIMADSVLPDATKTNIGILSLPSFLQKTIREPFGLLYKIKSPNINPSGYLIQYPKINEFNTMEQELQNGLLTVSAATATSATAGGINIFIDSDYERIDSIDNIRSLNLSVNEKKRFYKYEVTGQSSTELSANSVKPFTKSIDDSVDQIERTTRKVIPARLDSDPIQYANWLNNTSYAYSRKMNITVVGWRNSQGQFYEPGQLVELKDSEIIRQSKVRTNSEWLIETVSISQNPINQSTGTITKLTLIHPDAFSTIPAQRQDTNNLNNG